MSLRGCCSALDNGLHLPSVTVFHEVSSPLVFRLWRNPGRKETADRELADPDSGYNIPPKHPALTIEPWLKHPSPFPSSKE